MKKITLIIFIVVVALGLLYFANRKEAIAPIISAPEAGTKPVQFCFYKKTKTQNGLYDVNWLKMNILGSLVTGEFQYLPAEKDRKVGTFEGTVGPVDKVAMARTADVWWNSMAEGMQVKEQLIIVFGEGDAKAGFGEMVDRGDGVYVYKNPASLTYGVSMTDVACADLDSMK